MLGKPYALCKWYTQVNPLAHFQFYKITKLPKTVSQVRQEILEALQEWFEEKGLIEKGKALNQDVPMSNYGLDEEQELELLIYIEKSWNIAFSENAALELAKNSHVGTLSDLISITIRVMNRET